MKDLTHYFSSPKKAGNTSDCTKSPKEQDVFTDQSLNIKNDVHNSNITPGKKRHKAKKRKRKRAGPEVGKNKLNFISPSSTSTESQSTSPTTQIRKCHSESSNSASDQNISPQVPKDSESINLETEQGLNTPGTPKVNAFQFLMESRNNIIGSNSCGNPRLDSDNSSESGKLKLKARRRLLEDWADKKGASKRKRDDEDIDYCISVKLDKRAKRLKKILRVDKLKVQEKPKHDIAQINTKVICRSDSECSNDLLLIRNTNKAISEPLVNATMLTDNKSPNSLSPNCASPHKNSIQNNLLNFIEVGTKESSNCEVKLFEDSPIHDVKEVFKIKMFCPLTKKDRGSMSTSGSSPEEVKSKKHPKRKRLEININGVPKELKSADASSKTVFSSPDPENSHVEIMKSNKVRQHEYKKNKAKKNNVETPLNNQSTLKSTELDKYKNSYKDFKTEYNSTPNLKATSPTKLVGNATQERRSVRLRKEVNYKDFEIKPRTSVKNTKSGSPKKLKKAKRDKPIVNIELSSDSDHEEKNMTKKETPMKLAPVFLKSTPKLKIDPEIIHARKQFLLSGIPDSLKKTAEKQKSIEEKECNVFPLISHVQQKCESQFWNLSLCDFPQLPNSPLPIDTRNIKCENLIIKKLPYEIKLTPPEGESTQLKNAIQKIKVENSDYPVFKVFRQLYEKSGKRFLDDKKSPRKLSKKSKRKSQDITCEEDTVKEQEVWIDKYKPRVSADILGNYHGVAELRKWLEMWKHYSQEINAKKQRETFNSESEFESTDCESRDSTWLPGNTMILHGPCGSGKTSAVYAVANELKFKVLELNASTRRTGKILLQELQEATRSHQVRKHESSVKSNLKEPTKKHSTKGKNAKSNNDQTCEVDDKSHKKMCILLLEDIDLLFDQDEGFLSSLSQLIMTSKRPIILTTTDKSPPHVQRFMNQYEYIAFAPLSRHCLAVWLQILCLIEGCLADRDDLGSLLEYNKGDIRKTLLEVQFWAQSGGQLERNKVYSLKTGSACKDALKIQDEEYDVWRDGPKDDLNDQKQFIHRYCLGSFEIFRENKEYLIPKNMDLGILWWNIPNLLDVPTCNFSRIEKRVPQIESADPDLKYKQKIKCVSSIYDHLSVYDSLFTKVGCHTSKEPVVKSVSIEVLNSLELTARKEDGNIMFADVIQDVCHTLVNDSIENYARIDKAQPTINMGMPDTNERRWRANLHLCEDFLKEPIPLSNILDRRSSALDYLPVLRHITRSEEKRASSNTKRGNRFRHYLKELNIHFKSSTCQLASNCLNID